MGFTIKIEEYEYSNYFLIVDNIYKYVLLQLQILSKLSISPNTHVNKRDNYIYISDDKTPYRIYLCSPKKIVSFIFNFNIVLQKGNLLSVSFDSIICDAECVSCANSIVNQLIRGDREWINDIEMNDEEQFDAQTVQKSYKLIKHIIHTEPGYLRYDNDEKNANGKKHPQHHLDVNYSSLGTFKIGLDNEWHTGINKGQIIDMLNRNTDCYSIINNNK